ncbi:hypothetical protein R4Z09_20980 [Niallia oryzisoli]|uniref:Uncharacterized protein n=1 Tax=Niallia oryzisoli TaxID=1737571 RepID=A0ABZ2C9E8_9BACI
MTREQKLLGEIERIQKGGNAKGHKKLKQIGKLFVRDRIKLFFDEEKPFYQSL